ncbi:MAG: DUF6506 family protein [Deltaproteobacteria bacterium]|jgi:hypothetical protein|nr:DUF6506 family protein [Deltaproteobacteria bacterium]
MSLKAAFVFLAPNSNPQTHQAWVKTPEVEVLSIAVSNYADAEKLVEKLIADENIKAIELCGGFGHEGVSRIKKQAAGRAAVGVVRFDLHPGLGNKSGDDLF